MIHYASQLANGLAKHTSVRQLLPEGAETDLFDNAVDIQTVNVPVSLSDLNTNAVSRWWHLRKMLRQSRADVIHVTQVHPFLLGVLPTLYRERFALTLHDVVQHEGEYRHRRELATRGLVATADRVFVLSKHSKRVFERKFGQPDKVVPVPHGDYAFFTEYCEDDITYNKELLFFGRIKPYKGVEWLLKASERLAASSDLDDNYRIRIAGSGPIPDSHEVENVVVENEFVSPHRACALFSRCRAVVLPYREATQSGVIPIGYSFRKPAIATRTGGIPEVLDDGKTGALIPYGDTQALVESCKHFLTNEREACRMGKAAYAFKQEHMDWDEIAAQMLTAY
jgi:glycosyltransferase involved in cell wall biosynthesis